MSESNSAASTRTPTKRPLLSVRGICKQFGATNALRNVDLEIQEGEVHALIGENGAGKSTLVNILSGTYAMDSGSIELDGRPIIAGSPIHARGMGISTIYQELSLALHLSVEENLLLGAEPSRWGWVNRAERRKRAREALAALHHETLPLEAPLYRLSLAERQIVEIARACLGSARLMIMDEPTSSLSRSDVEILFAVIRKLKEKGVGVIYISHFLEECREIADRFTVLRDGQTVGRGEMVATDFKQIVRLMVGREVSEIFPKPENLPGETVLELEKVSGVRKPRNVSLQLRKGEIFGIAGLIGAGRTETLRAIFGLDALGGGAVLVRRKDKTRSSPWLRLADGIGFLSENRKDEGLLLNRSLAENLCATRYRPYSRFGFVNSQKLRYSAGSWLKKLQVKARNENQPVAELSGGNQQKVALGRLLHHDAEIYLLDEPTRGIDIGSKEQIYRLMNELASKGKAIIFVSSYLPELLGVCHTIGVMRRGILTEIRSVEDWSEHRLLESALGRQTS